MDAAGGVAEVSRPTILTFALNSTKHIAHDLPLRSSHETCRLTYNNLGFKNAFLKASDEAAIELVLFPKASRFAL